MWYRPESTNIDRGGADVNIGILRSISHHVQCLNSQQLFYYIISLSKKETRAEVDGTPSQIPAFRPITLTLGSRSHKMLLSTFNIIWPMHLWSLKLLCPMVKEMKHLQKIHYMTLTYGSRSHQMLSSALQIISPLHLQSLKLLRPTVRRRCIYKKVHYLTLTCRSRSH